MKKSITLAMAGLLAAGAVLTPVNVLAGNTTERKITYKAGVFDMDGYTVEIPADLSLSDENYVGSDFDTNKDKAKQYDVVLTLNQDVTTLGKKVKISVKSTNGSDKAEDATGNIMKDNPETVTAATAPVYGFFTSRGDATLAPGNVGLIVNGDGNTPTLLATFVDTATPQSPPADEIALAGKNKATCTNKIGLVSKGKQAGLETKEFSDKLTFSITEE